MSNTISEEALGFLYSGAFGLLLGALYDMLRILRLPRKKVLGMFLDAVYVLVSCLMLLGFVLTVLDGQMRAYVLLGIGIGWAVYAYTFSSTVLAIFSVIFRVIARILRGIGSFLHHVFGGIYHVMRTVCRRVSDGHRKKREKEKFCGREKKKTGDFSPEIDTDGFLQSMRSGRSPRSRFKFTVKKQ